jgi:phage gpG-like protein
VADALRITITGDDALERDLGIYADRLRRPFLLTDARERVVTYVTREAARQIKEGQHGDYKALSPTYRSWKSRRYPSRPLLVVTGRTVRSMTDEYSRDFHNQVSAGGRTLTVGTDYPVAGYHQKGTGRMPARPLFVVTRRVAERMAETVAEALPKKLGQ